MRNASPPSDEKSFSPNQKSFGIFGPKHAPGLTKLREGSQPQPSHPTHQPTPEFVIKLKGGGQRKEPFFVSLLSWGLLGAPRGSQGLLGAPGGQAQAQAQNKGGDWLEMQHVCGWALPLVRKS